MAKKGKMVTGGVTTTGPGQKPTTRKQSKAEVNRVVKEGKKAAGETPLGNDLGLDTDVNKQYDAVAAAQRDLRAMSRQEGNPFGLRRRGVSTYVPVARDIKKGVVQDPNVFKGDDAPLPRATSRQLDEAAAAQRRLDAVKATRDAGGKPKKNVREQEEQDRAKIGRISQYSGGSGLDSQRCATPGCNNNTSEITCTDCTAAGDKAGKTYKDAPHERAIQRSAAAGASSSRVAELQNGLKQGQGAA